MGTGGTPIPQNVPSGVTGGGGGSVYYPTEEERLIKSRRDKLNREESEWEIILKIFLDQCQ